MNSLLLACVILQIVLSSSAKSRFDIRDILALLNQTMETPSQPPPISIQPPSQPAMQPQPVMQPQVVSEGQISVATPPSGSFPIPPALISGPQEVSGSGSVTIFPILNPSANRPTVRPPPGPGPVGPGYPYPYPVPTASPQDVQSNLINLSRRVNRLESLNELWKENFMTMRENFRRLLRRVNALSE